MSSYDSTLFERIDAGFFLSQRFKQNFHKFYGTLRLAFQMVLTNAVLAYCPRPLMYVIMCIYLIFAIILLIHLAHQLRLKKKLRDVEDFDLLSVANPRHKIISRFGSIDLIGISFFTLMFVLFRVIVTEKLGIGSRFFFCACIISYMLFYLIPQLKRIRSKSKVNPIYRLQERELETPSS